MAIQFDLNALSRFSNVNFGDNDAIANLDGGNGLVQNEKLGFILPKFSSLPRNNVPEADIGYDGYSCLIVQSCRRMRSERNLSFRSGECIHVLRRQMFSNRGTSS